MLGEEDLRGKRSLTDEERRALLDRSEYEPTGDVPSDPIERFWTRCRLCGAEVDVTINILSGGDRDRRRWDPEARRQKCSHQKHRSLRPLGPITQGEARALLKVLETNGVELNTTLERAVRKLRRTAGLPDT